MDASPRIRLLSDNVANKIAAGEVVERPASVVKELIENAIDSGASQIDVEIVAGGRKLVSITDNGCGMDRDNLLLSVERHATSKIRDVDDIEHISTLGFRGEALAAIGSVSRFRIATCAAGATMGSELVADGGKMRDVRDIGHPPGTTIEVRDLFFNVPARRKFLRSHQTELSHVRATFLVMALANPALGMSLRVDGRDAYRVAGGASFADRLADLFGKDYLRNLRPVSHQACGVAVSGFVSVPSVHRADRNEQYVFVNGRAATAPLVSYAIREGYHGLLSGGRHASVFLFITLDHEQVDVNVHPMKREVRFRRPTDVRDTIIAAVRFALSSESAASAASTDPLADGHIPEAASVPVARVQLSIQNLPRTPAFRYPRGARGATPAADTVGRPADTSGMFKPSSAPPEPPRPADVSGEAAASPEAPWAWCRVLGQVGGYYVLLETEEGYVVMDPRAAHERVLYEAYMRAVEQDSVVGQNLLIPETVELRPGDARRVRKQLDLLTAMGFGISEFGGDAFVVDALPAVFSGSHAEPLLLELSHAMEQAGSRGSQGRWREELVARAASRSAVQSRDSLTLEEIEQLVVDLARAEMPYTSPRGRPTLIFTPFSELHRKFGRS